MNELNADEQGYVPKQLWARLKATGMSRKQIGDAINEPVNGRFCDKLRGACLSSADLLRRLHALAEAIECGIYVPESPLHVDCPNTGGFFANVSDDFEPPLPPSATEARVGSEEKKQVMRDRAAAGYALHHPGDSRVHIPLGSAEVARTMMAAVEDEYDSSDEM